jgi:FkbM family methyltransferase
LEIRDRGVIRRLFRWLKSYVKIHFLNDRAAAALRDWRKDRGDESLRLNYPLTDNSIVFDVGGHKGEWAQNIAERYDPCIFIFEPIPSSFDLIQRKFEHNKKIKVYNYGLSNKTETVSMSLLNDGSSVYRSGGKKIRASLMDIVEFLKTSEIKNVELIKINIEGGEYPLLKRMIESGVVKNCNDIQVQFHKFYKNAEALRAEIQCCLQETHDLTYNYQFVWENWRRKVS